MKLSRIDAAELSSNPRASFAAWQRYEPIVLNAMRTFPRPYLFKPGSLSASTVVSRIRDAIRGKIAFDYPSSITADDVARWYTCIIVKEVGDRVFIGSKDEKMMSRIAPIEDAGSDLSFDTLTQEELDAFCILISKGRVAGPVLIRNPGDLEIPSDRPNFQTLSRPDGSLVLL